MDKRYGLELTDGDKKNIVTLLNRVATKGLGEAQMLLTYATAIKNAPEIPNAPDNQPTDGTPHDRD